MERLYRFLDKLGFTNKDFETLGLLIQIYAGIFLFFFGYVLFAITIIGSDFINIIGGHLVPFGTTAIISFLMFILVIAMFVAVAVFFAGKTAKDNHDKPQEKQQLKTWSIVLLVILVIDIVLSIRGMTFGRLFLALIQIAVVILYFYFVDRIEEFNSPAHVPGTIIEKETDTNKTVQDLSSESRESKKFDAPGNPFDLRAKDNKSGFKKDIDYVQNKEKEYFVEEETFVEEVVEDLVDNQSELKNEEYESTSEEYKEQAESILEINEQKESQEEIERVPIEEQITKKESSDDNIEL